MKRGVNRLNGRIKNVLEMDEEKMIRTLREILKTTVLSDSESMIGMKKGGLR